jgi:hypothetical protein
VVNEDKATLYRADLNSTNSKDYKVTYKGRELRGVIAIEYIPELNM